MVDGHDVAAAARRLRPGARASTGKPFAIVARTFKGKGVSFLEDKDGWHGKPVKKGEELPRAIAELGDTSVTPRREAAALPAPPRAARRARSTLTPAYTLGPGGRDPRGLRRPRSRSSPRSARDVVAIDGDTKNSTFAEKLKDVAPERFAEGYIAEQNMVGAALGMATEGKIPFASTFACFLTRAYDFIRMAAYSRPPHLVLVRQPRRGLDRRGRAVADGPRGPRDDARDHRARPCSIRATR